MASISIDEEVRLYTNNTEREKYNLLATLFGIIVALEYLERAYVRDSITATEYVVAPSPMEIAKVFILVIEIFAGMYAIAVAVQNYAQVGGRRSAVNRAVHDPLSGRSWLPSRLDR